ncbi:MAG: hypothetical protein OXU51_09070, partial [Candidatus Poribacteria bacterium]|nr:hypothetical protein [Candidatus Poribacteria bacterium]
KLVLNLRKSGPNKRWHYKNREKVKKSKTQNDSLKIKMLECLALATQHRHTIKAEVTVGCPYFS